MGWFICENSDPHGKSHGEYPEIKNPFNLSVESEVVKSIIQREEEMAERSSRQLTKPSLSNIVYRKRLQASAVHPGL